MRTNGAQAERRDDGGVQQRGQHARARAAGRRPPRVACIGQSSTFRLHVKGYILSRQRITVRHCFGEYSTAKHLRPGLRTQAMVGYMTYCTSVSGGLAQCSARLTCANLTSWPAGWRTSADCGVSLRTRRDDRVASSTCACASSARLQDANWHTLLAQQQGGGCCQY